jgi:hypothetical protein
MAETSINETALHKIGKWHSLFSTATTGQVSQRIFVTEIVIRAKMQGISLQEETLSMYV